MNRIVLLGTGCPSPSHIRYGPSTLISTEKHKILIDAGSGVTQRLSEFGLAPSEIDVILITHLHSDHIVDLYQLYISGWHTGRTRPFKIVGPKGIKKFFDKTVEAYADELNLREIIKEDNIESFIGINDSIIHMNCGDTEAKKLCESLKTK